MVKIYQALQEARKTRSNLQAPAGAEEGASAPEVSGLKHEESLIPSVFKPVPAAAPKGMVLPLTLELEAEKEMAALFQNVEALLRQTPKKIIQFIGSHSGEGASTVARDFARFSASRLGKQVLFLEGDPAHPSEAFPGEGREITLEETVRLGEEVAKTFSWSRESGLAVGLVAREEGSMMHFLESEDCAPVWSHLRDHFDLVVIDSPPLSSSTAGLAFCRWADGVILVLEADRTRAPVAENAKEQICKNGGKILGVVFNKRYYHIPKFIYKRL
jgi:protein-tyrosine kinase